MSLVYVLLLSMLFMQDILWCRHRPSSRAPSGAKQTESVGTVQGTLCTSVLARALDGLGAVVRKHAPTEGPLFVLL